MLRELKRFIISVMLPVVVVGAVILFLCLICLIFIEGEGHQLREKGELK